MARTLRPRLIVREQSGRGEWRSFWKQHQYSLAPWPPTASGMVLNRKKREPGQSETSQSNGSSAAAELSLPLWPAPRWSAALLREDQCVIFYKGPDLISAEHKSQFRSKRTPGNKAVLCQECLVFLFCCSYIFNNSWFSLSRILSGQTWYSSVKHSCKTYGTQKQAEQQEGRCNFWGLLASCRELLVRSSSSFMLMYFPVRFFEFITQQSDTFQS